MSYNAYDISQIGLPYSSLPWVEFELRCDSLKYIFIFVRFRFKHIDDIYS